MFSYLMLNLFFSLAGACYFMYGKRQTELWFMLAGAFLMVFPYVVSETLPMLLVGAALMAAPFAVRRWME